MDNFPTGTITFLFTDIEGSTQLWERAPQTMKFALARHDMLLRRSIEQRGGMSSRLLGMPSMRLFRTPQMPFRRSSMLNGRFVPRDGPQKSARSEFVQSCTLVQQKNAEAITSACRSIGRHACSLRDMVIKPSSHRQLRNWCTTPCRRGCHYLILVNTA